MMRIVYIFCFLLFLTSSVSCKKATVGGDMVERVVHDSVIPIQEKPKPDKRKEILDSFEQLFAEECKKWPVSFHKDTIGSRQTWTDNLGLSKHEKLISSQYILYIDKNIRERSISIEAFTLAGNEAAEKVIKDHCDTYHLLEKNDKEADFIYENVYAKMPYFAVRIDSTIYEITATNPVGHIMHNVVDSLKNEYWYYISRNDIIPCDRDYMSKALAKNLKPALNKWMKYYNADISDFYTDGTSDEIDIELYNKPFEEDTLSIYYRKYIKNEDDVYTPMLYDYSPNKKYYLTVRETSGVYRDEDGKWYYQGGDDCQEVYLVNRGSRKKVMIMWLGTSAFAEAAFWADNKTYVIVGRDYSSLTRRLFISIGGVWYYSDRADFQDESYFEYDLKQRGVITD